MKVKVDGFDKKKIKDRLFSDKVGIFAATQMAKMMDAYVPMDTGQLKDNITIKPFEVTYNSDYAKKMYYGTKLNFSKDKHPLASSRWNIPMRNAKGDALAKDIENFIKRG